MLGVHIQCWPRDTTPLGWLTGISAANLMGRHPAPLMFFSLPMQNFRNETTVVWYVADYWAGDCYALSFPFIIDNRL